jgi:hypothetical protein
MTQPTRRPTNPFIAVGISAAIAIAILGDLLVPLYAKTTPKIGDFPFFYAFLLIWMPVVAILLWLVQVLQRRLPTATASASTGTPPTSGNEKEVK